MQKSKVCTFFSDTRSSFCLGLEWERDAWTKTFTRNNNIKSFTDHDLYTRDSSQLAPRVQVRAPRPLRAEGRPARPRPRLDLGVLLRRGHAAVPEGGRGTRAAKVRERILFSPSNTMYVLCTTNAKLIFSPSGWRCPPTTSCTT